MTLKFGEGLQAAPATQRPGSLGAPAERLWSQRRNRQSGHGQKKGLEADASRNGDLAYD